MNHGTDSKDVTQREEVLRESEERVRAIADSSPMMIWMSDIEGQITFVNRAYLEFFDLRPEQAVDFQWQTILHPDDAVRYIAAFKAAIAANAPFRACTRMRRCDGAWRWVESRATPRLSAAGSAVGYVGCSPDVTEMYESQQTLKEADRRKDEFLATLAHELRNPLAPLRNGLQIMKLARGNDEMLERARSMMERQLHLLASLVDDLLDVSRISRGQVEIRKQRVDIAAVIRGALETSEPLLRQGNHDLTVTLPPQPVYIYADKVRLAQAVSNLLVNAAKYTESGGRIALDVTTDNGKAYISVKDTGVGIPEHMLTRIFDMFTQVDSSISLAQGGLGIGLTIVKRLVEMHGGTVSVHSRGRGMGSEFTIRLPAEASLVGEPQSENKAAAHTNAVQHRILVVDDNKEAALSLTLMLQLMGNDAQSAYDGAEAVKVAELYRPDIVLMDIAMPKLNGYAAARLIREQSWGKGVALVAVTGWGQEVDRKTSQESGFDHHLVKPVEPQDLEKLLMSFDPTTAGRPV